MIVVDTGPLVALFDPRDRLHPRCRGILAKIREPLHTTVPVLTEALHMLSPGSYGADRLREFIRRRGLSVWLFNGTALARAFDLMEQYSDHPMDLADASLVVAAEELKTRKIFTVDRKDFQVYRLKAGHGHYPFEIVS